MDAARTLQRGDDGFPPRLAAIPEAPERLRVRGPLGAPGERRVAIVGMRHPDPYGIELAREIARDLARAGVCVVSGGAEGIDGAAHEAALEASGRTIAVMGTGLDVVYPAGHRPLFERIVASGGALVSEYEDGQRGERWTFPRRNRLVSGMSEAVLVVRAGERSGALITAGWARRQGVPVFAVPGDVRLEGSAGPLALLRQGARVAASARDLLEALGLSGQLSLPERAAPVEVDGDEAAVLGALGRVPRHADEVARAAGVAPAAALSALLVLELRGLCEQRPGHLFLRRG
ncbi:MAG TPA: DNA-processing protein DprA [Anaeromyxobacteraceae bacterium]